METFNFMLSGSDEEILNALRIVNDITTELDSTFPTSRNYSNDEVKASDLPDSSYNFDTVSDFSEDSGCPKLHDSKTVKDEKNLFHMELEYQNLLQNISSLRVMCDLCIEKGRRMEAENNDQIKMAIEGSKQVLSVSMLSENLINIETTASHVLAIAKQFSQIKQVLRNGPSKSTLKVNPSSQKSVIKFFHLANELMENLEKDKNRIEACLENSVDNWNPTCRQLKLQICKILEEIERRIDNLIEFRSNLGVLSTGVEEVNKKTVSGVESYFNIPHNSVEINPAISDPTLLLNL